MLMQDFTWEPKQTACSLLPHYVPISGPSLRLAIPKVGFAFGAFNQKWKKNFPRLIEMD